MDVTRHLHKVRMDRLQEEFAGREGIFDGKVISPFKMSSGCCTAIDEERNVRLDAIIKLLAPGRLCSTEVCVEWN